MKDPDLEDFLSSLRNEKPDEVSLQRWKAKVRDEVRTASRNADSRRWVERAVAVAVGILIGGLAFGWKSGPPEFGTNTADNATIEYVVTKMN